MMRVTTILSLMLPAVAAAGQIVRLRADARVSGGAVRLADVAAVSDLPAGAAEVVVFRFDADGRRGEIDLPGVQAALRRAGVNPVPI
ncbi:MAG: hypothetical protein ACOC7R_05050, partial [Planctomycetota bacterium]